MDKIQKFLHKLSKKQRAEILQIFQDLLDLNLKNYDIKPLKGYKGLFRLRKGNIRIVFAKKENKGVIFDVAFRKDIYENL